MPSIPTGLPHGDEDLETRSRSHWRRNAAIVGGLLAGTAAYLLAGKGCDGDNGKSSVQPGVDTTKVKAAPDTLKVKPGPVQPDTTKKTPDAPKAGAHVEYIVKSGDNLWEIVSGHYAAQLPKLQRAMGTDLNHAIVNVLEKVRQYNEKVLGIATFYDTHAVWSAQKYNSTPKAQRPALIKKIGNDYVVRAKDTIADAYPHTVLRVGQKILLPNPNDLGYGTDIGQVVTGQQKAQPYAASQSTSYRSAPHTVKGGAKTVDVKDSLKAVGKDSVDYKAKWRIENEPKDSLAVAPTDTPAVAPRDSIADVVNDTTHVGLPANAVYLDTTGVQSAQYNSGKNRVEVQYQKDKANPQADSLGIANAQLINMQMKNPALYKAVMAGKH